MTAHLSSTSASPLHGIHAATVCPLAEDGAVDEKALAVHVGEVARTAGIAGLLVNGHAGEGALLSRDEKRRVLEIVRAATPDGAFICAGISAEASELAAAEAEDAAECGADAVLVFPPNAWALGHDAEMAVAHHRRIAERTDLPLVLYRAPILAGRMAYGIDTLRRLVEIERVIGIKEGSWEVAAYEEVRRAVHATRPDVAVLASGDEHLLTGYLIGTEGSQVSLAAIIPRTIVALFEAAQARDWARARRLHDGFYALAVAIYRNPPGYLATPRLKTCLAILGRIPDEGVKLPLHRAGREDRAMLLAALDTAMALETSLEGEPTRIAVAIGS